MPANPMSELVLNVLKIYKNWSRANTGIYKLYQFLITTSQWFTSPITLNKAPLYFSPINNLKSISSLLLYNIALDNLFIFLCTLQIEIFHSRKYLNLPEFPENLIALHYKASLYAWMVVFYISRRIFETLKLFPPGSIDSPIFNDHSGLVVPLISEHMAMSMLTVK